MGWLEKLWQPKEEKEGQQEEKKRIFPPKKEQFLILLLVGLLLMVIVWPSDTSSDAQKKQGSGTKENAQETDSQEETEALQASDYAAYLEKRLAVCLAEMDGVGRVEVFVTLKGTQEAVLAKDKSSTTAKSGSDGEETLESQSDEETVYADGESGQTPYVVKELMPAVRGVLVVAEGGDDPLIQQNILEAVEALFSIESHKIKVVRMKEGNG